MTKKKAVAGGTTYEPPDPGWEAADGLELALPTTLAHLRAWLLDATSALGADGDVALGGAGIVVTPLVVDDGPPDPPDPVPASWTATVTDPLLVFALAYDGNATADIAVAAAPTAVATALNALVLDPPVVFTVTGASPVYNVASVDASGALTGGTNCTVAPGATKGKK